MDVFRANEVERPIIFNHGLEPPYFNDHGCLRRAMIISVRFLLLEYVMYFRTVL